MNSTSYTRLLNKIALFEGVEPSVLNHLATACQIQDFGPRNIIMRKGDKSEVVYFVLEGTLKIWSSHTVNSISSRRESSQGEAILETLINVVGRGDLLGEIHAFDGNGHSANVETTEKAILLQVSRTSLMEAKTQSPILSDRLSAVVTKRLRALTERQSWMVAANLEHRLGFLLLMFAERFAPSGLLNNQEIVIPIRLTQYELSHLVGGCRYRTGQGLRKLQKQNLIKNYPCHRISVVNPEVLASWCRIE